MLSERLRTVPSALPELSSLMDTGTYRCWLKKMRPGSSLLAAWDNVRHLLLQRDQTVIPAAFLAAVQFRASASRNIEFVGFQQSDAHEFLQFVIERFHSEISRPVSMEVTGEIKTDRDALAKKCYAAIQKQFGREWSEFVPLFFGQTVTQILSLNGKTRYSERPEVFCILPVNINPATDSCLESTISNFCVREVLSVDNKWHDDVAGTYRSVYRQTVFWSLPELFVIQLCRWLPSTRKDRGALTFPVDSLDMSKYVIGYRADQYRYRLSAVCYHHGASGAGGHYTAAARVIDGSWMHFDDRIVRHIPVTELNRSDAYLLFYSKIK